MGATIRTFIAADIPGPVRDGLRRVQAELKKEPIQFRWVKPENIHLTLAFLGAVNAGLIDAIVDAMVSAGRLFTPMHLIARGLGVFPSIKRPRIFWAGIGEEVRHLGELKQALDRELMTVPGLAFKPDRRPFKAHLTIGRAKGRMDAKRLAAAMTKVGPLLATRFVVNGLTLYKSDLRPGGAVYTKLNHIGLG